MKTLQVLLFTTLVGILFSVPVSAQNGADVERSDWWPGQGPFFMVAWETGVPMDEETIISVHSFDDPNINCGDVIPELQPGFHQLSELPNDIIQHLDHRKFFTRVMVGIPEEFWMDPCTFIQTADRLAEGITPGTYRRTINPTQHRVGGFTIAGPLYDLVGMCGDGMVNFNLVRRFQWSARRGFQELSLKGPRLSCNE
jgi:hypothetical protein